MARKSQNAPWMRRPTPMGVARGEPRSRELSNLFGNILIFILRDGKRDLLEAHVVVVSLGLIVEAASVVDGNVLALLGEVGAVTGLQNLLLNAHFGSVCVI